MIASQLLDEKVFKNLPALPAGRRAAGRNQDPMRNLLRNVYFIYFMGFFIRIVLQIIIYA